MDHLVDVGGCRLFVRTIGERYTRRPWVILSNCVGADHTMWDAEVQWLARSHRVLVYDARGHGRSEGSSGELTLTDLVVDVVKLMDHFGIERMTFVGLSLGGMTGLGLALAHPSRLAHLVCCNARSDAPPAFVAMWEKRIRTIEEEGMVALCAPTLEGWVGSTQPPANTVLMAKLARMFQGTSAAGYIACAKALQGLDYRRSLMEIRVPTLFVAGADDTAAPAATMKEMAAAVPEASFALIPRARHLSNIDNPQLFRGAVEAFISMMAMD
jgi:3-oxoadipate enol-lactonase